GSPKVGKLGPSKIGELPAAIRASVANLPAGRVAPPVDQPEGLLVSMVCTREDATTVQLPSLEQVRRMIEEERLDMLTRRYLRDLRRSAFVDIRM
ncbi:MAG TPA: peptidyl-prolyl cis-trans isomerase, partial [Candidatus Omnitrophota bacterium]|nr:peptidyl-prolyl cis-trans isomerase [Candidatus Omnitrophota bacterium]